MEWQKKSPEIFEGFLIIFLKAYSLKIPPTVMIL